MGGPLGGVGDLYAILGASAYLGAQMVKSMGPLTDPTCPIEGLNALLRKVFEEVAVDDELEREVFAMIEDPARTDDVWNLVAEIRERIRRMQDVAKWNDPNAPYESMYHPDPTIKLHPAFRRRMETGFLDMGYDVEHYFSPYGTTKYDVKKNKELFPFHTQDGKLAEESNLSFQEQLKRGPKWLFFDVPEMINKPLAENRLVVAEYIMRMWHHRHPREIVQYDLANFSTLEFIGAIGKIINHGRRELELRKTVDEKLSLPESECSKWLDDCWTKIKRFKSENSLFYQLIHDHPVYSYRGDALHLVREGNDGFVNYDEYPTCWDYVGIAKPSLDNPINKEHFIIMLMASYKMVPLQVEVDELFDVKIERGTVIWRYYSKNGTIQNWIRGEDWQNELKTTEEKELEHEEFLERTDWALSDRFDL